MNWQVFSIDPTATGAKTIQSISNSNASAPAASSSLILTYGWFTVS